MACLESEPMLEGEFFNPAMLGTAPALVQVWSVLLFCGVFLFLWRHSGVVYFGFWSLAWAIELLALISNFAAVGSGLSVFTWFRALFEFFFALSLFTLARSSTTATARGFQSWLRSMLLFPGLLLVVYLFAWRLSLVQFHAVHAVILALIYGHSFLSVGAKSSLTSGLGGKMLRFTLACLFLQFLCLAAVYFYAVLGGHPAWMSDLSWTSVYELAPLTLLAFSAMAMWIQTQQDSIEQLRSEIDSLEKSSAGSAELDHLTGLQNRMALDRILDECFSGVVAVCDMDYFKDINDRFGHLVGDEVLRSVGHLIRSSIRAEDAAFRWGGDEFVIVFRHQHLELALGRMTVLEDRLQTFRIRGHGLFPLGLSWGAAEGNDRALRPVLEEADQHMYKRKREAHAKNV